MLTGRALHGRRSPVLRRVPNLPPPAGHLPAATLHRACFRVSKTALLAVGPRQVAGMAADPRRHRRTAWAPAVPSRESCAAGRLQQAPWATLGHSTGIQVDGSSDQLPRGRVACCVRACQCPYAVMCFRKGRAIRHRRLRTASQLCFLFKAMGQLEAGNMKGPVQPTDPVGPQLMETPQVRATSREGLPVARELSRKR